MYFFVILAFFAPALILTLAEETYLYFKRRSLVQSSEKKG